MGMLPLNSLASLDSGYLQQKFVLHDCLVVGEERTIMYGVSLPNGMIEWSCD